MSRSFKKHPYYKYVRKGYKKIANKVVRRYKHDIKNGCFYKRIYQSWNVVDDIYYQYDAKARLRELRPLLKKALNVLYEVNITEEEYYDLVEQITDRLALRMYIRK